MRPSMRPHSAWRYPRHANCPERPPAAAGGALSPGPRGHNSCSFPALRRAGREVQEGFGAVIRCRKELQELCIGVGVSGGRGGRWVRGALGSARDDGGPRLLRTHTRGDDRRPSIRAEGAAVGRGPRHAATANRHDLDQASGARPDCSAWATPTAPETAGDGETPVHEVWLDAFSIDATTVTNAAFARFVADTGYRTESELFGYSAVFHLASAGRPRRRGRPTAADAVVVGGARRRLGASGRAALVARRPGRASGGAGELERRAGLLRLGRAATADRGRVGVRRARRAGRRAATRGATSGTRGSAATSGRAGFPR